MAAPRVGHDFSRVPVHNGHDRPITVDDRPWHLTAYGHPRLPTGTPAWSENGAVVLSAQALLAPPALRTEMLLHEAIHSTHQRAAPRDDSPAARATAERLATSPAAFASRKALPPVPSLLGFPPQPHKPFDRVWIGHSGIVGEIVRSGITVRVLVPYDRIGIDPGDPGKAFHCGKHDMPPIPDLVKRMIDVAAITAKLNKDLPAKVQPYTAQLVGVIDEGSAYRLANGKPVIILKEAELTSGQYPDTLAHETSHAIYEYHSVANDPKKRTPDVYALAIADLFNRAKNTARVPHPTTKFDPGKPPPLTGEGAGVEAGLAMATDTLWAGSGGHPWGGPDEFFASAYAGFLRNPELQKKIFTHYAKADTEVGLIAKELLRLLAIAKDQKALGKLKTPPQTAEAAAAIERAGEPWDIGSYTYGVGWLVEPSKMPGPEQIKC
jgi:hypothetical protein